MGDDLLGAVGDFLTEAGETAADVGEELLAGDVEGAVEAATEGEQAEETGAAAQAVVDAAGQVAQAAGAGAMGAGAAAGQAAAGAAAGLLGAAAAAAADAGISIDVSVDTPLGSRDVSASADASGIHASTQAEGWSGTEDASLDIDSGGVAARYEGVTEVGGVRLLGVEGSAEAGPGGVAASAGTETPLGTRDVSASADAGGIHASTQGEGWAGTEDASLDIGSEGASAHYEGVTEVGGVRLLGVEGSVEIGQGAAPPSDAESGAPAAAGPAPVPGAEQADLGVAFDIAGRPGRAPTGDSGSHAAPPTERGPDTGAPEITPAAGPVGAEPGAASGGVPGMEEAAGIEPGAGLEEEAAPPEAGAAAPTEPGAPGATSAPDELGLGAPTAITGVAAAAEEPAPTVTAGATTPWEQPERDELGLATVAAQGAAAGQKGAADTAPVAVAAPTTEPQAVVWEEPERDELGVAAPVAHPTAVATPEAAPHEEGAEAAPMAVAAPTTEPEAVLWDDGSTATDSGPEDASVTSPDGDDEGGGLGGILGRAAAAVGEFIENVVEEVKDFFTGGDDNDDE